MEINHLNRTTNMSTDEYISELETLVDESGISLSDAAIKRIAKRAKELESDSDFSEDDILDELLEVLPKKYADDEDVTELITQFADTVLAELENCGNVENEENED